MEIDSVKIKNLILNIVKSTEDGHLDVCVLELLGIDAGDKQISEWLDANNINIEDNHLFDNMNLLTVEDEIALIPLAQNGNKKAMEAIVLKLEPYVRYTFKKYFSSFRSATISHDDILSDMHSMLVEGIHSYNVSSSRAEGGTFIRYYSRIIQKYRYSLHISASTNTISMFNMNVRTLSCVYKVWDAHRNYLQEYNAEPTIEQLSELTDISVARVRKYLELMNLATYQFNDLTLNILKDAPTEYDEYTNTVKRMEYDTFVSTQLNEEERDLILFRQQQAELRGRVPTDSMQEYADEHNTSVSNLYAILTKIRKKYHAYVST